jgi:hypothetical protein
MCALIHKEEGRRKKVEGEGQGEEKEKRKINMFLHPSSLPHSTSSTSAA